MKRKVRWFVVFVLCTSALYAFLGPRSGNLPGDPMNAGEIAALTAGQYGSCTDSFQCEGRGTDWPNCTRELSGLCKNPGSTCGTCYGPRWRVCDLLSEQGCTQGSTSGCCQLDTICHDSTQGGHGMCRCVSGGTPTTLGLKMLCWN